MPRSNGAPPLTEMATARSSHGVVVCKDKLYVVGGKDAEGTVLDSVEVYDFASEAWGILPVPMPQARTSINNAVVQHKGKVYVVGGLGWRGEYLQRVAVYDIAAEEWSVLPAEMMENRRAHAAAVHGNQIYLLGGVGHTTLRSVEVYDIAAGEWSMISVEMQVARSAFAAAVHGDNLYAIGGMSVEAQHAMEVLTLPSRGPQPGTPPSPTRSRGPFPSSCTALPAPTPSPRTCSSRSSGCCSELPSSNQL